MGIREWLFGKREVPAAAPEPPYRDDACPSCGGTHFQPGPPVVKARSNGVNTQARPEGAMLLCYACGSAWYTTAAGLVEPHELAMPPAWAAVAERVNARQAAAPRPNGQQGDTRQRRRTPGPHEGFATPPKV